jgi:hypothetical protein
MTEMWTFRSYTPQETAPPDVAGFDVDAVDGHIGKIDDATYDAGAGCIVVDTGFWIFGKRRMIPAGAITRIDLDEQTVQVSLTKEQIKSAPDFDDDQRDDERYRQDLSEYYGPF